MFHSKKYLVLHHTAGPAPSDDRYHGLIFPDGRFFHKKNILLPASATYRFNSATVNLALVGNFEFDKPTEAALKTVVQVSYAWLFFLRLPVDALVSHQFVGRHAAGSPRYETACCGKHLLEKLPLLRSKVESYFKNKA